MIMEKKMPRELKKVSEDTATPPPPPSNLNK